ncbi:MULTISPECIES: hypothetical protein [unclassified Romboutsia]|uniref:hypothetical protein n=1 Tax=unclassified Romboutsia TaxID=2626894 RepID=UPI000821B8C8|nr:MULTISPECIES: hypothetical protein [unclassified Romboutsia]SCI14599.1 Uncharacterised protein [uncultured Clostridium sp.]
MNNKLNNQDTSNKYKWNNAMILDKIQYVLKDENLDELELTEEFLEHIKSQLSESISSEEINKSAYIVAQNIDELKVLPNEDIKDYILRLKNYLNNTTLKCIKSEYKGIEFDVYQDSSVDDVFSEYYSKYDQTYGISQMLSDLGLK